MPDRFVVRAVVVSLGIIALAVVVGAVALSICDHSIPEALWTIAGTAVGAVAGILSKTNTEPAPVQPVQVVNPPETPVPVDALDEPVQKIPSATAKKVALAGEKPTRKKS